MPHHNSHYYEFGPYRLDAGQRVLTRTGEAVSLTPKATEILTLLVANAGQLVGKDELLQQVWPDTFVEESNLTQNIFLLRRVLGDKRPTPRYIETVVRRGYRFIANVRVIGESGLGDSDDSRDPCHPRDLRFTVTGSGSEYSNGDDTAAPPTVAVLPFLNATGNDDLEYLVDGLTDNLVNNLSRVSKLRVMSRSAVFRYKAKKLLDAYRLVKKGLSVWGRCHLELATTLKDLAACEDQASYHDEAQLHYRSALNESEAIGNHRMAAIVENNLGFLLLNLGLLDESEKRLLRARLFFKALSDNVRHAQVNETLTRLYIASGEYSVAQRTIDDALQTLELTDGEAVLSEALTTSGIVACRLQRFVDAQKRFESACKVAERCGDREGARRALVSMFEEMKKRLNMDELRQMREKLSRLSAVTEPSPLVGRVGETIAGIRSMSEQDKSE